MVRWIGQLQLRQQISATIYGANDRPKREGKIAAIGTSPARGTNRIHRGTIAIRVKIGVITNNVGRNRIASGTISIRNHRNVFHKIAINGTNLGIGISASKGMIAASSATIGTSEISAETSGAINNNNAQINSNSKGRINTGRNVLHNANRSISMRSLRPKAFSN